MKTSFRTSIALGSLATALVFAPSDAFAQQAPAGQGDLAEQGDINEPAEPLGPGNTDLDDPNVIIVTAQGRS